MFNSKTFKEEEHPRDEKGRFSNGNANKKLPTNEHYQNPQSDFTMPDIPKNIIEKLGKTQKPLVLKKNIIEKNKEHHPEVNIDEYNNILDAGIYKANVIFKTNNEDEYYNFVHYGENKNPQILVELSDNKDNYEIVNFYKLNDKNLQRKLKQAIKRVDNEGGQVLIDIEGKPSKVGVLSNLEIDSTNSIPSIQSNFNPSVTKHEVIKEQDMTLLEDLKKLIKKVENNKEE